GGWWRLVEVGGGWWRVVEVGGGRWRSVEVGSERGQPPRTSTNLDSLHQPPVLRKSAVLISLHKPALGSACPDNRHATTHPIRTKLSSTTFPPSDSTDNSSPFASRYAGRKTGSGVGACYSGHPIPRRSAPRRRSSAPRRSRTCGRRCGTCGITTSAISTAPCCRWPIRWTRSGGCG